MKRMVRLRMVKTWGILLGAVGLISLGSWVILGGWGHAGAQAPGPAFQSPSAREGFSYAESLSQAFREAAEKTLPAVVMIRTLPQVEDRPNQEPRRRPEPFEGFPFDDEESPFGDLFRMHPELRRFFQEIPQMPSIPHPLRRVSEAV